MTLVSGNFYCKAYADIRMGSLERTHNDSKVARQHTRCCRMLMCIRCVRNKLTVSLDVGFWGD